MTVSYAPGKGQTTVILIAPNARAADADRRLDQASKHMITKDHIDCWIPEADAAVAVVACAACAYVANASAVEAAVAVAAVVTVAVVVALV